MRTNERRAAIAAYKERKAEAGIYAVRCTASAHVWVGAAPDLSTIQNRLWFTLRNNSNPIESLQEMWRMHGQDAFSFDVIERLKENDDPAYIRNTALRIRHAYWVGKLNGIRI
ncbi:hypothetical protein AD940_02180 [Gluconobacter thailandicus]|nr:hypothetical protein AD940_02180 [Gluconobacter thailandicus]